MKKFVAVFIPVALIAFFILIMISAPFLKKSFGENDNVQTIMEEIKNEVNNGKWAEARESTVELEAAWNIIIDRVQFSVERDELKEIQTSLARMEGYIEANDRSGSLAELAVVKEHWTNLGE
ncbi:MAG TPA: DUF4363 family protein [Anaerovoracaceae bacterium]|nr:DUF4363 family protein [Anaerovoracaceae bacterium]